MTAPDTLTLAYLKDEEIHLIERYRASYASVPVTDTALPANLQARDSAIRPALIAVELATEHWARESKDGAAVWAVAKKHLPEMWEEWNFIRNLPEWQMSPGRGIREILLSVSVIANDNDVVEAVNAARNTLLDYRD